jgi:hypothetical protein
MNQSVEADHFTHEIGVVHYFDFEIERYSGLRESDMEKYGCIYIITRDDFLHTIKKQTIKSLYHRYDIRAKVVFPNEKPYFISRDGISRHGNNFYSVDKNKFEEYLKLIYCPEVEC